MRSGRKGSTNEVAANRYRRLFRLRLDGSESLYAGAVKLLGGAEHVPRINGVATAMGMASYSSVFV